MEIVMHWATAELLGAVRPINPGQHRAMLRGPWFVIRTRESLPMFWPNQLDAAELASLLTRRSSQ